MDTLPVRLLTDLLAPAELITADGVKRTHHVNFCPIGICLPQESQIAENYYIGDEHISEFRYTPKAYFAIKVWETVRDALLSQPEFAGALDIEWYPVAATFNSIRYIKGTIDCFIKSMFDAMERIANTSAIEIKYGRFDTPPIKGLSNLPCRYYIMPPDIFSAKLNYGIGNSLDSLQGKAVGRMSWDDIKDSFVLLKPIQLAFIAGAPMNRHTTLDDEFIRACEYFDFEKVKELVAKGANIHAATDYGDTAMSALIMDYNDAMRDGEDNSQHENLYKIAQYLLSLGYNLNLAGHCDSTPLFNTIYIKCPDVARFLLDNGADPNAPSFIGDEYPLGETVLSAAWEDIEFSEEPRCLELPRILLLNGALPVPKGDTVDENYIGDWIEEQKEKGLWDDGLVESMTQFDAALVHAARRLLFWRVALFVQSGANIDLRDKRGRNLLQVVLEDARPNSQTPKEIEYFKNNITEMSLMMLCGLKLKLSDAEIEQAKRTCKTKGYTETIEAISSIAN